MRSTSDEYTPEQRRMIDARLSTENAGKQYGPFTVDEAVAFLKAELKARKKVASKARENVGDRGRHPLRNRRGSV